MVRLGLIGSRPSSWRAPAALLTAAVLLASPSLASVQHPDEPEDKREVVAEALDELANLVGKSGKSDPNDARAIALIGQVKREYWPSGPLDRHAILRGTSRVFLARRKTNKDGSRQTRLFIEAARALGTLGADADEPLIKWIGNPRHRDDLGLQKELILSLGRTHTKKARRELHELLTDHRPTFIAAAAKAMGNFTFEPSKVRKELFEDLLKALLQADGNAQNSDSTALAIWYAMSGPATASMRALSGASASSPQAWQHWWNKNKRRDWDE